MKKSVNYLGWVGFHNIGDEAIYLACQKLFHDYDFVFKDKLYYSSITLMGGGTLLPHWAYLTQSNIYNYGIGLGVRDPLFWGEYDRYLIQAVKNYHFKYLGVRGKRSQEILADWGIASEVVGDTALALEPKRYNVNSSNLIIINAGISDEKMWGNNPKQVFNLLVDFCKYLRHHKFEVIILPFWNKDIPYCQELSEKASVHMFKEWDTVSNTLDIISEAHLLIGEKLHSIVLSAACFVPFLSLEYRPKCREFASSVGFDKYNIKIDELNFEILINTFDDLLSQRKVLNSQLRNDVNNYRVKLEKFSKKISQDIESIPEGKLRARNKTYNYVKELYQKNSIRFSDNNIEFIRAVLDKIL